jgi:hypothetical protein
MAAAPKLTVESIELFERDVVLRLPFRFGVVTLTAAPQAFVRARVRLEGGRESVGAAAEMLAPKWFDKNLALSNEDNFEQLREAVRLAGAAYTSDRTPRAAFEHFAAHYAGVLAAGAAKELNPLVASYGPALVDRAVLDALCRGIGISFFAAMRDNVAGISVGALTPDLAGFDVAGFLRRREPARSLAARHTVGLVDPLTAADVSAPLNDGLPETLEQVVGTYGHDHFKVKVAGDVKADLERLTRIALVLDRLPRPYVVTLDGNEQYRDVDGVVELWRRMAEAPRLARLAAATVFIEQPIVRSEALARPVTALAALKPVLIDESDATLDTFPEARKLGYTGVSSKSCKGFYKSIFNAARCAQWNAREGAGRFFLSAEDLTCQAGLAVQQDLALVALLGVSHVERNGHHYVKGFGGAPAAEQRAFLAAHPDLYRDDASGVRVRIEGGQLRIGSLACNGFASGALPEWAALRKVN